MTKTNQVNNIKLLVLLSLINKINQNEIEEVSNIEETQVEIEETNTTSKDTTKDNTKEEQIISNINQRNLCNLQKSVKNPCYKFNFDINNIDENGNAILGEVTNQSLKDRVSYYTKANKYEIAYSYDGLGNRIAQPLAR